MTEHHEIKIIGIGNLVRRDEGVGIHLLRQLEDIVPPQVELIDGGTTGLILMDYVESADKLIVLDAVEAGKEPGEVVIWQNEQVPYFIASKMSAHQVGFAEVLSLTKLRGNYPEEIAVIGIQPQSLEWGTELSKPMEKALPPAKEEVLKLLKKWGIKIP